MYDRVSVWYIPHLFNILPQFAWGEAIFLYNHQMTKQRTWAHYRFPAILLISILTGGVAGIVLGREASVLKPVGDIFINLMLTAVMPLVFFSVSSAIAQMGHVSQLWKITSKTLLVFVLTGVVAAAIMLFVVVCFPPAQCVDLVPWQSVTIAPVALGQQLAGIFTVTDFYHLFSYKNMLPMLVFSALVGVAVLLMGAKARRFARLLNLGATIFLKVVTYIMYLAPIGFFAYFAVVVAEIGPRMAESYFRVVGIYYVTAILYFLLVYTLYAYLADRRHGVASFWQHVSLPMLTALGTCSSAASIPANLAAAEQMRIRPEIYETAIPLGAILHKDGSVLGGMVKIAFLFGIYHLPFAGASVYLTAMLIAVLVGTVMGAIPSGGMLGELLILSCYGFPPEALMMIAVISILIDPLATMLNVTGDIVCCMLVQSTTKRT